MIKTKEDALKFAMKYSGQGKKILDKRNSFGPSREKGYENELHVISKGRRSSYLFGEDKALFRDDWFGVERDITDEVNRFENNC